jgi:UDP-N-acetylglucosamine 1-carboxyvinyltransferase
MEYFEIIGGKKLKGAVTVNSSKNAAVALLMGSLINKGKTTLKNVPQIEEVNRLTEVLKSLGVKITARGKNLEIITPEKIEIEKINRQSAEKTRSIILLAGALAGRLKKYSIPQCGGCRLGSRTIAPHLMALEELGLKIKTGKKGIEINSENLRPAKKIVLYETGDTATENALLAASQVPGKTIIKLASANYMVQDLCWYLEKLGVKIKGTGTGTLEVYGQKNIKKNVAYEIGEDPIEAMFFLSIAATCKAELRINRCPIDFLELELLKLSKMGMRYRIVKNYVSGNRKTKLVDIATQPSTLTALSDKIHPLPSAGINIDNLPFFAPIACITRGKTLIHDWVFENRAIYLKELNKLGAKVILVDPHRVVISGPSKLKGTDIVCPPALRPAAIILVAMLAARGKSILRGVYPIKRGYENLEGRLREIGAEIKFFDDGK